MSVACCVPLVECVSCLACIRWVWKKFLYTAGRESENWGLATATEFEPIPRLCRYILSVYEDDLTNPIWAPPGGYGMNPQWVLLKKDYVDTQGKVSPYMIYLDHDNADIVVAIRGLNLGKESDFLLLLDNKLGQTTYDGGYVHNGLLKAAQYVLQEECGILRELVERNPDYTLTFAGHSLGAGVVTLLTMLAVKNREKLGHIERKRIRCFAIAPARCISLNLAVRYADVINSVVLQILFDSFPCLLCIMCLKDTCTLEEKMLQDPRRLYAPGRLYHIIVRKPFRCKRISPLVKTAVPVDGRFEHIVLSCNATSDHAIIWILQESERAFDETMISHCYDIGLCGSPFTSSSITCFPGRVVVYVLVVILSLVNFPSAVFAGKGANNGIPPAQRMERQASLVKEHMEEHRAAIERAVALDVPHAYSPSYGTFHEMEKGENSSAAQEAKGYA
ncbi:UNVERIFIED_CONTAM: hypothetical protein Sradi_1133900 [Sesamum radiatum]|uniref:Alpha/beta-Hydrolases superfamily protein n=1 Tax=Sesamum radiatum TaxID=300843 RepID=A0AAW2V966_SESRA